MLTAERINGNIVIDGVVDADDVYPDVCCEGFGWRVVLTYYDGTHRRENRVWGICDNPQCTLMDNETYAHPFFSLTPTELGERLCR